MRIRAGADDFVAAYDAARAPLMASPHCTSFDLSRCVEDPTQFILRLEWTSAEDHMKGFRDSPEFREFFALVKPFYDDIQEMRHYEQLLEAAP
ncbi:putative quinol monooxygenase [Jannaschia aquimarina]|uniref:Antibiotic biosynthesis monooxygenase n=1 Tax=Jannaschia aquimarina TaxID=935700 RepID=A0A0D1EHB2_9RHOB|nr:antibiotic biosynthesis monooxygenase family protein [Jannaschia aquimarina]KIT17064.1 Antibiotic biosynthesis monooxygenase [Jannaschia aquimarina]SNS82616.1 Quinol monooxygenase YgiN [Jannaschia aquimarina]